MAGESKEDNANCITLRQMRQYENSAIFQTVSASFTTQINFPIPERFKFLSHLTWFVKPECSPTVFREDTNTAVGQLPSARCESLATRKRVILQV